MAKAVLLNSPLYGHVYPTLALARELVQRGEQVTCFLSAEFEQEVNATGAAFQPYSSLRRAHDPVVGEITHFQIDECLHVVPQVLESVLAEQPDYVLYESVCLWGGLIAHRLRVPAIRCNALLEVNSHFTLLSPALPPAAFALSILEIYNRLQALRDLCDSYGLPHIEGLDARSLFAHAEDLNIVFVPRSFQPAGETFDERFVFVGPCLAPRKETGNASLQSWLASPELPLLYISLGTLPNAQALFFFQQCIQAFADQPWRLLMALGPQQEGADPGPLPANIRAYPSVPQLEVLEHTSLFLTHGGNNSIMEALFYGVPMVVVPHNLERAANARRVAELGLGVALEPQNVSASSLLQAVTRVATDHAFHQRAQQMRSTIQAAGGVQRAAEAVLQFVAVHSSGGRR